MGANIEFGLVTHIAFSVEETEATKKYFSDIDHLKKVLTQEINLDMALFDLTESDEAYTFVIKEEILEPTKLLAFLNEFLHGIYLNDRESFNFYCGDLLGKVKELESAKEIIRCALDKNDYDIRSFRVQQYMSKIVEVPFYKGCFTISFIGLFHQGKAFLESYNPLFFYIERLIRSTHSHPQANVIKVFLE